MPKEQPVILYDYAGREVNRGATDLDPYFLKSGRTGGTGAASTPAAREPYKYHSWVYACIDRIITPLAGLPRVLYNSSDETKLIKDHPLLDLFVKPNPQMNGSDLWEATMLCLLLPTKRTPGGQCFWVLESGRKGEPFDPSRGELPTEIWPYSDNFIEPVVEEQKLTGWKMSIGGKTLQIFKPNEVIRIRKYNPYSVIQGLSPYSPAEIPVIQDVKSDEYNTKFFDNYGAVGGMLTTDNDTVTARELQAFADWFDNRYGGGGNAGRTVALSHGLKYDHFTLSNLDMQFAEQRKDNRQRIQAVYGVNDAELGIFDSGMNRATAEQADRNVWQKARLPLDKKIMDTLNAVWIKFMKPGGLVLKSDTSHVDALKDNYTERIKDATELVQRGYVPPAEAFRVSGVPVDTIKYPWMEKVFVPMSLIDIELLAEGYVSPFNQQGTNQPPEKALVSMLCNMVAKKATNGNKEIFAAVDADTLAHTVAKADKSYRDDLWNAYEKAVLTPGERTMREKIIRHLYGQRNEMLDMVDAWEKKYGESKDVKISKDTYAISVDMFLFDSDKSNKELLSTYKPEVRKQMERELRNLKKTYGDIINWKVTEPEIKKFIKQREDKLENINTVRMSRARKEITQSIDKAINEQMTVKETAKLLKDNINGLYPTSMGQANVIARTEISAVSNYSRMESFEQSGAEYHEWLSARDELVRPTHQEADGEVRRIGEMFSNGLRYPQDPLGSAADTINCRCISILRLA